MLVATQNPAAGRSIMFTKTKIAVPLFILVAGLVLVGVGIPAIESVERTSLSFILMWVLGIFGCTAVVLGLFGIVERLDNKHQQTGFTISYAGSYLSNPIFLLVVGLLLGGFGMYGMFTARGDAIFHISALILTICGFSTAIYGLMGTLGDERPKKLTKRELQEVHELSQNLKVRYPTYILKVQKLKEKYEALHENFDEVRKHFEEFKDRTRTFQTTLAELAELLHSNLQKHAPVIDNDNVESIAKKILWSDKQMELLQLDTNLKTLVEKESPITSTEYRCVLNQVRADIKKLENGIALYHELLITSTKETATFDAIQTLKQEVEERDELMAHHEIELQKLAVDTQTQYEFSKMALSLFQERLEEFKTGCEF